MDVKQYEFKHRRAVVMVEHNKCLLEEAYSLFNISKKKLKEYEYDVPYRTIIRREHYINQQRVDMTVGILDESINFMNVSKQEYCNAFQNSNNTIPRLLTALDHLNFNIDMVNICIDDMRIKLDEIRYGIYSVHNTCAVRILLDDIITVRSKLLSLKDCLLSNELTEASCLSEIQIDDISRRYYALIS